MATFWGHFNCKLAKLIFASTPKLWHRRPYTQYSLLCTNKCHVPSYTCDLHSSTTSVWSFYWSAQFQYCHVTNTVISTVPILPPVCYHDFHKSNTSTCLLSWFPQVQNFHVTNTMIPTNPVLPPNQYHDLHSSNNSTWSMSWSPQFQ